MEVGTTKTRVERLTDLIARVDTKLERNAQPELKDFFAAQKLTYTLELELLEAKALLAEMQAKPVKAKK